MTQTPERQALIERLRGFPAELEAAVSGLTERQLYTVFIPSEWTVAQNVHHLADSHMQAYSRTRWILTEDQPTVKPYDQDAWAGLADYRLPVASSLAILSGLHMRWAALFESLSEAQWARVGIHPEAGTISAASILEAYVRHGAGHLEQMARTLAAGG